jgi:hypothetical protein
MAWDGPDKYAGKLVLPATPDHAAAAPPAEPEQPSVYDLVTQAIEALYECEPKLTRNLLERLRAASRTDLERLFGP